jgi:formate hydrogenlyase subunit 3/multisubunit Na+/H+ antiporter MnhD subunit
MNKHARTISKLKDALAKTAFASLIADICISTLTLLSLKIGKSYTLSILFFVNYILTGIVIIALLLMVAIFILANKDKVDRVIFTFKLKDRRNRFK